MTVWQFHVNARLCPNFVCYQEEKGVTSIGLQQLSVGKADLVRKKKPSKGENTKRIKEHICNLHEKEFLQRWKIKAAGTFHITTQRKKGPDEVKRNYMAFSKLVA